MQAAPKEIVDQIKANAESQTGVTPTDEHILEVSPDNNNLCHLLPELVGQHFGIELRPYYLTIERVPGAAGEIIQICSPLKKDASGLALYILGSEGKTFSPGTEGIQMPIAGKNSWLFRAITEEENIPRAKWRKTITVVEWKSICQRWGGRTDIRAQNDEKDFIRAMVQATNKKYNNSQLDSASEEKLIEVIEQQIKAQTDQTPASAGDSITARIACGVLNQAFDLNLYPYAVKFARDEGQALSFYVEAQPLADELASQATDPIILSIDEFTRKPGQKYGILDSEKKPPKRLMRNVSSIQDFLRSLAPAEQTGEPQAAAEPSTVETGPEVTLPPAQAKHKSERKRSRRNSARKQRTRSETGIARGPVEVGATISETAPDIAPESPTAGLSAGTIVGPSEKTPDKSSADLAASAPTTSYADDTAGPSEKAPDKSSVRVAVGLPEYRIGFNGNTVEPYPGFRTGREQKNVTICIRHIQSGDMPQSFLSKIGWETPYGNVEGHLPQGDYVHYRVRSPDDNDRYRAGSWRIVRELNTCDLYLTNNHYGENEKGDTPPFYFLGNLFKIRNPVAPVLQE